MRFRVADYYTNRINGKIFIDIVFVYLFLLDTVLRHNIAGRALNINDFKVINANESRDSNKCVHIFT